MKLIVIPQSITRYDIIYKLGQITKQRFKSKQFISEKGVTENEKVCNLIQTLM